MEQHVLREYIELIISEGRQAHLSGGRNCDWGHEDHISDLETRVADARYWRDRYPRGSEKRARYRDVVSHLQRELQSAKRRKNQNTINEKQSKKKK